MTKQERIAVVRIISDLIKTFDFINIGELEMYAKLRRKYRINDELECAANEMLLSTAMHILADADDNVCKSLIDDCMAMTVCDDVCTSSKALLIMAIKKCLVNDTKKTYEVLSFRLPEMEFNEGQILFVESSYNASVNEEITQNHRLIRNELSLIGLQFVYVPYFAEHCRKFQEGIFKVLSKFVAPNLTSQELTVFIELISHVKTHDFCQIWLCNHLGIKQLRYSKPALLIELSNNYVNNQRFSNFLKIDLVDSVVNTIQNFVDELKQMIGADIITINRLKERKDRVSYKGFYKQLFDMYTIRQGVTSTLVIDPYHEKILFPEIGRELQGLRRKEKAFYALLVSQTKHGGLNFNAPICVKEKELYDKRIQYLKRMYSQWYSLFGGDQNKTPDIEKSEIRNPMISVIRKCINQFKSQLINVADYSICKDEYGNYTVPLDSGLIKVKRNPIDD